ncbi:hypothetical protein Tco_0640251 [Tanacetum coccineum]
MCDQSNRIREVTLKDQCMVTTNLLVVIHKEPAQKGRPKKNKGTIYVGLDENVGGGSSSSVKGDVVSGGTVRGSVVRGGRGRGGGVVRGKGDAVKGGRGRGKGTNMRRMMIRGGTITGSRLIDEINVDETDRGEGIETSRAATVGGICWWYDTFEIKTLGLRVRRGIGKRNVVAENVRYNMLGKWFGINESNPTPSEDNGPVTPSEDNEGSIREADNVMQEAYLNEQATGWIHKTFKQETRSNAHDLD